MREKIEKNGGINMENKVLIFGHKNPDTDSITSSLVMENLERKLGNENVKAVRLGDVNKETQYVLNYLGIEAPELISEVEPNQEVILVDHNDKTQSIDNIGDAKVLKVIDHHAINFTVSSPLYYRAEPVGCTATVLYKLYKENEVEVDKTAATLMLSAIASDTLVLKSPTTTDYDKKVVKELEKITGLDINEYGVDMLKAGTDISDFTPEQVINIDSKLFEQSNKKFRIAQVNTASIPEVMKMKEDLEAGINKIIKEKDLDLFMFLITDIVNSNTQTIALGKKASIVEKAYGVKLKDNTALLEGVVSRKKQVVPIMTENA